MTFADLFDRLRSTDENAGLEAKRGSQLDDSFLESVSAFSNEPGLGGGHILLGVARKQDSLFPGYASEYEVVGVPDPDTLLGNVATLCREAFNIPVRPNTWTEEVEGRRVVVVSVPEAAVHNKPIYIRRKGLDHGAYRRIGSTDQRCTHEDIAYLHQQRDHKTYDQTPLNDASLSDLDMDAIHEYRRLRAIERPAAVELGFSDDELLHALHATTLVDGNVRPTVAGMLLFGKRSALRRHFPLHRVDYIVVPGREWVPDAERRFSTQEYLEPLVTLVPRLVSLVLSDVPKAFSIPSASGSRYTSLIPDLVLQEAIVNSVMHRNYAIREPVQIIRFSNRLLIRNPGHSLKAEERLGEPGSLNRNEKLAAVLHELGFADTKGSGIRSMIERMQKANLTEPVFESDRIGNQFSVTMFTHHLLGEEDVRWLEGFADCDLSPEEARLLVIVREIGDINNAVVRSTLKVDTLPASRILQHLRDLELLAQKGQGTNTYYNPGPRMLRSLSGEPLPSKSDSLPSNPRPLTSNLGPLPSNPDALTGNPSTPANELEDRGSTEARGEDQGSRPFPREVQDMLGRLGKRSAESNIDEAIVILCSIRDYSADDLAVLIRRDVKWLRTKYLSRLLRTGRIFLTMPNNPNHPEQKYRASDPSVLRGS